MIKNLINEVLGKERRIRGILIINSKVASKTQILDTIRSLEGVTSINDTPDERFVDRMHVSIKLNSYPFIPKGGYTPNVRKSIIKKINKISGVRKFIDRSDSLPRPKNRQPNPNKGIQNRPSF